MFQNNLGITCQSLVILAERIIIQLPAEMERSILVENHLHCFCRDGRLSRPWCEVAPANIWTCNLPITSPSIYHTAIRYDSGPDCLFHTWLTSLRQNISQHKGGCGIGLGWCRALNIVVCNSLCQMLLILKNLGKVVPGNERGPISHRHGVQLSVIFLFDKFYFSCSSWSLEKLSMCKD